MGEDKVVALTLSHGVPSISIQQLWGTNYKAASQVRHLTRTAFPLCFRIVYVNNGTETQHIGREIEPNCLGFPAPLRRASASPIQATGKHVPRITANYVDSLS